MVVDSPGRGFLNGLDLIDGCDRGDSRKKERTQAEGE